MKLGAEVVCIILITFCFTVGVSYLWGYTAGAQSVQCYVTPSE